MKIGLLGGAFNPPHLAHLHMAQQALDFADFNEVWFLPNYGQQPPKPDVASVSDRLAMVDMLTLPKTKISTLEIDNKLSGNTIDLLPFLPEGNTYTFLMGADWLPGFKEWGNWEELLEKLPFLVFPRAGFANEPIHKNMTVFSHPLLMINDISATKIRERVKQGLPIDQFVPTGVATYIKEHGLYK